MTNNNNNTNIQLDIQNHDKNKCLVTCKMNEKILHHDTVNIHKEKDRKRFAEALHNKFNGIDPEVIEGKLLEQAAKLSDQSNAATKTEHSPDQILEQTDASLVSEATAMLKNPHLVDLIQQDIATYGIAGEKYATMAIYVSGTSRLLDVPLSLMVQGPSSSGKSIIVEKVTELIPDESKLKADSISPMALYYMRQGSLMHCLVVGGERRRANTDENADSTRTLREMIGSQVLRKAVTIKNKEGEFETKTIIQPGPIAYMETTTSNDIFEEDRNRCLVIQPNEQEQQTRLIMEHQAKQQENPRTKSELERIRQKHFTMQRILAKAAREHVIVIPFANDLVEVLPSKTVEMRRIMPMLFSIIKAFALLHHLQRERIDNRIIASREDYEMAYTYFKNPLAEAMGLALAERELRLMKSMADGNSMPVVFSTTDATKKSGLSKTTIADSLKKLCNEGWIDQVETRRGPKPAIWRLRELPESGFDSALPTPDELFSTKMQMAGDNSLACSQPASPDDTESTGGESAGGVSQVESECPSSQLDT